MCSRAQISGALSLELPYATRSITLGSGNVRPLPRQDALSCSGSVNHWTTVESPSTCMERVARDLKKCDKVPLNLWTDEIFKDVEAMKHSCRGSSVLPG